MRITIIIIIVMSVVCCNYSNAQDILVTPLFDKKKFESIEFYDFLEDERGFLWIASNHGIFRYDGVHLTNYLKKDSISFEDILGLFEDSKGRIWFSNFRRGITYYDYNKNDFVIPSWNNQLTKHLIGSWISDVFVAPDTSIWLQKFSFRADSIIDVFQVKNDSLIKYGFEHSWEVAPFLKAHSFTNEQKELFYQIEKKLQYPSITLDTTLYLGINKNKIVGYNSLFPKKENNLQSVIRMIIEVDEGELWGLVFNGFIEYPNAKKSTIFLRQYQINNICKLSNGSYLFSTVKDGVFSSSSIEIRKHNFQERTETVTAVDVKEGALYVRTKDNIYYKPPTISSLKKLVSIDENYKNINKPSRFLIWNNNIIINDLALFNGRQERLISEEIGLIVRGRSKSIVPINDSLLMIATATGFIIVDDKRALVTNSQELGYDTWTYITSSVAPSKIWMGTPNGIIEYDYKEQSFEKIPLPIDGLKVKQIKGSKDRCVFVGSQMDGLLIVAPNQPIMRVNTQQQLNANDVLSILLENDTTAWVGTSNGINKVVFSPISSTVEVSSYLTRIAINDLALLKDTIWAVGEGSLLHLSKKIKPLGKKRTSLLITTLKVNGQDYPVDNRRIELKRNENTVQINFTNVNFKKERPTVFCYALLPENSMDTIWQYTNEYSVNYSELSPGMYTFLLTTKQEKKGDIAAVEYLEINIQRYFVDTIYFYLLIYLLSILGISGVAWLVIRSVKRRAELKKALVESQLKLLRTQMNPHFLFNTLNSILGHITMQDLWSSTMYLSSFSQLVRDILENSKHSFLPLDKELEMLQAYIKLEKMRLGEAYDIDIEIKDVGLLSAFYIPPMLIQPFIENAIIHGLAPKEGGKVTVVVEEFEPEYLKITIRDTGIGRKAAASKQIGWEGLSSKTSLGIENVKERVAIINKTYQLKLNFSIEDLYNEKGTATGTNVQILLPKFDYINYMNR